jgi:hypothetical protein
MSGLQKINRHRAAKAAATGTLMFCAFSAPSQAQQGGAAIGLAKVQLAAISRLANDLQGKFGAKNCQGKRCKVLVMNFTLPSGESGQSCRLLSDAVSSELETGGYKTEVLTRERLQSFLETERIPSKKLVSRDELEWLGDQLGASQVLYGVVDPEKEHELLLTIHLLDVQIVFLGTKENREWRVSLPALNLAAGLAPSEPFPAELNPHPKRMARK